MNLFTPRTAQWTAVELTYRYRYLSVSKTVFFTLIIDATYLMKFATLYCSHQ